MLFANRERRKPRTSSPPAPAARRRSALDALADGSAVMDLTTMMKLIREDIEAALRRFKIAIEDIPAQVQEFEQRVRN